MSATRRCYEAGHRPKFLVVADETEEADRALYFATRRAARVGATVSLLATYEPDAFTNWFGVGDVMRAEAEADANALLVRFAARAREIGGVEAEIRVRQGRRSDEIGALIAEDEDIALLVLGAAAGSDGPGPLVAAIAGKSVGAFAIPVAIVPGGLSDQEIDSLA